MPDNQLYSLVKKKDTGQPHLFLAKKENQECFDDSDDNKSICKKLDFKDLKVASNGFHCENEQTARKKCAEIGITVCGPCVSSLYADY